MVRPSGDADPSYVKAFREIVSRIERSVRGSLAGKAAGPIGMYVAGGAAMHFYTGACISADVDASFSRRLIPPDKLEVTYADAQGQARLLYFDTQYNESFALLHERAHEDSVPLEIEGLDLEILDLRLLAPLDLAVSKIARLEEHDRQDIRALAQAGLIDAEALRTRAEEALADYVGDERRVRTSIDIACDIVRSVSKRRR